MADISKITLPSGTTYNIKDATAREQIAQITGAVTGVMTYLGVTTTALSDGSSASPIKISNTDVTPKAGDVVIYGNLEFVFSETDNKWHEFGSTGSLKALAFKDSASGKFTPAGSVSQPTFTGSSSSVAITATANASGNYTPAGTVSKPTFTGTATTSSGKFTPAGSVSVSSNTTTNKTATVSAAASGTVTYTPAGSVSKPTFSGTAFTSSGKFTPAGTIGFTNENKTAEIKALLTGTANYTPSGTISGFSAETTGKEYENFYAPSDSHIVKSINVVNAGGTAPENELAYYSVSGETLTLNRIGYEPNFTSSVSALTDMKLKFNTPTFNGRAVRLVTDNISVPTSASFTGTEGDVSVSGTPTGSVSQPTFTGTGARLVTGNIPVPSTYTATFTGTEGDVSVSGTPTGTVSQPTFTGTKVQLSGTTTAAGTVSKPTFTGTEGTVTVS